CGREGSLAVPPHLHRPGRGGLISVRELGSVFAYRRQTTFPATGGSLGWRIGALLGSVVALPSRLPAEGASGSGAASSGLRSAATREDDANSAAKRADGGSTAEGASGRGTRRPVSA